MTECNICLTEISGQQWGIININILDSGWVDIEDKINGAVHPFCIDEAVMCYASELGDGFLENYFIKGAKDD